MTRRPGRSPNARQSSGQAWNVRRRSLADDDASGRVQMLGLLVILSISALLALHGLALATSAGNAGRTLRSILPPLTDLDQALAAHRDAVRAQAPAGEPVAVPGVPLAIHIPAEVAAGEDATIHRVAADAMARAVRDEGASAFRADGTATGKPGLFSRQWTVERTLTLLTAGSHDRFVRLRTYALLPAIVFGVLLAWASGLRRAPVSLGSAVVFGAMLGVLFALLGRMAAWVVGSGAGGVTAEIVGRVARDLSMTVIAVAVAAGAGGALAAVAGAVVVRALPEEAGWGGLTTSGGRGARPNQWEEG